VVPCIQLVVVVGKGGAQHLIGTGGGEMIVPSSELVVVVGKGGA